MWNRNVVMKETEKKGGLVGGSWLTSFSHGVLNYRMSSEFHQFHVSCVSGARGPQLCRRLHSKTHICSSSGNLQGRV